MSKVRIARQINQAYTHLNLAITEIENDGDSDTILDSLYASLGTLRDLVDDTDNPEDVDLKRDPWEGLAEDDDDREV